MVESSTIYKMPSQTHPQAQFVPIAPDFDLNALIENTTNFDYVTRLSTEKLKEHSIQSFEALILAVVIQSGKPLVIEDWGDSLPPWLFSKTWLEENVGKTPEKVRDIPNGIDIPMTLGHYLRSMHQLTVQLSNPKTYRDPKKQRLYLKDIDTPDAWASHLKNTIPECVYYLNDCIESRTGGDGAIREPNEYGQMRYGKGVAPAGDLMSSLPSEMRALNMMCYIGHEGTYTPAHREMCASLGHNIMVEASKDGEGEKAGSSIWFMTETKEREVVSEYFLSMLGHDIEVERHFAQVNAWKKAPFNVWVVEQKVGDLILIPPLAPHQVWNCGTRTMKAAWNRTTVDTLELALHEALPRGRMVCRDEQYKCKAIIYYTLVKYYDLLQRDTIEQKMWKYGRIKQLLDDFRRLFNLYQEVLVSEMFSPKLPEEENVEFLPFDSNVTCSYCRCNIFNRFLTCKACILHGDNGAEDTYDVCMDCYAMGRSCACISHLSWVEQWDWTILVENYEKWRGIVVQSDGFFDSYRSPQPLDIARKRYGKKPIAEVCQEQLKLRPWTDVTKPKEPSPDISDIEPEVNDEGRVKTRKGVRKSKFTKIGKRKVERDKNKTHACHICCHHDHNWKLAFCTTCPNAYCYGTLWRAFDMMPHSVMEDREWQCPKCLKMCSCGKCRKNPSQTPYQPKGTLLGHDTRKVADYRSVESLVDFSKTNLIWLRDENDHNPHKSGRMKKLKEKAEAEKAKVDAVDESFLKGDTHEDPFGDGFGVGADVNNLNDIDPALRDHNIFNSEINDLSHYQTTYPQMGLDSGDGMPLDDMEDPGNNWVEDHYDLEDSIAFNPQSEFSGAPGASIVHSNSHQTYPDPSHVGQTRMMGIGYYQQGQGLDRILYDPPNSNGSAEELSQDLAPAYNPNMAMSDLLEPVLQQPESTKKRKKYGNGGYLSDEDVEFFTSKKQRQLANARKNQENITGDILSEKTPQFKPPRRSAGKVQTYVDLDEADVSIDDDDGLLTVGDHKTKPADRKPNLELVDAMKRFSKPIPKERKRGRVGGENMPVSPSSAPNTIRTPRKSAWLARKEAEEAGDDFSSELPQGTKQPHSSTTMSTSNATVISSSSETEDGGVTLDDDGGYDSLFDEPVAREKSAEEGIEWKSSEVDPSVKIAERRNSSVSRIQDIYAPIEIQTVIALEAHPNGNSEEPPPPKRRGRPPKKKPAMKDLRSPSPLPTIPVQMSKMLSLREKQALKGKSFKIVAQKSRPSPQKGSTPQTASKHSLMPKSILKTSTTKNPSTWSSVNDSYHTSSPATTAQSESQADGQKVAGQQPISRPTIVRLMSPSDHSDFEEYGHRKTPETSPSYSSSDGDIPAVKVLPKPANRGSISLRGRGAPRGMRARRGRPITIRK